MEKIYINGSEKSNITNKIPLKNSEGVLYF